MFKNLKLNNVSALQFFQLLRFAAFFITGIGLAKSGIGLSEIGIFETLMFISGILSFFWVSGLLNTFISAYDKNSDSEKQGLQLFNVFLLLLIGSVIVFAVLRLFEEQISNVFSNGTI
ncbi:MAG: hypothetical protein HKN22_04685, partial [Bacteroidia bacterium]|nr:hypothetical protein [Bacteroidia bacterium]